MRDRNLWQRHQLHGLPGNGLQSLPVAARGPRSRRRYGGAGARRASKLPSLDGTNLHHGRDTADFFGQEQRPSAVGRFSLLISNPPWAEPEGEAQTSADAWAARAEAPFVRRQIAGAYALRTADFLLEGGRVCLILPIGQFLGPSSASFVSHLFGAYRPLRLLNFGDLQGLLFPTAENTCHVFLGERRPTSAARVIPFGETFDYCVPKADMSLALGRLTMQSADRHQLQTQSVAQDPQTARDNDCGATAMISRSGPG